MLTNHLKNKFKLINKLSNGNIYFFLRFLVRIILVPLTYLIWIIEPFKKVRFHRGQTSRIGHLTSYFEILVRSKEIDIKEGKRLEVFIVKTKKPNKTLYEMWKQKLFFIESDKLDFLYHLCSPWLSNRRHFGPKHVGHAALPPARPTLKFSNAQILKGIEIGKQNGIKEKDWYVCLHNRSPIFLKENYSGKNWDRHNIRDCKFQNLFAAAKLIKKFGGKCIRMSSGEKEPLSKSAPNNIIDYASKWQSDFMDIYLPAHCKFFLGPPTGLLNVSQIFNIPVAITNCIPINSPSLPLNGVFIPKLLWYKEDKRFLSYKEILNGGLENCYNISKLNSLGIEVVENDPDDIFLLTEDMFDLLNNKRLSKKDEGIRNTFMKNYFVESKFINKNISKEKFIHSGKISWRFLLKHSYLMNN